MPVAFDADVADQGEAALAANNIAYAVLHLDTVGPAARPLEAYAPDHYMRIGWLSFGDTLSVIGATARHYWRAPLWVDVTDLLWTPDPSSYPLGALTLFATRVRWVFATGTSGHLYVFSL
jgi:hypothetical protein